MRRSATTWAQVPAVTPCGLRAVLGRGAARFTSTLPFRSRGATVAALLRAVVAGRPVVIGNANLSAELHALYRALSAAGCEVHHVVDAAAAIVVPTTAMTDRLRRLAPHLDPARVVHIPWGIPDQLLAAPPPSPRQRADGELRLLYAGRLTAEKGADGLAATCAEVPGVHLSIAAPHHEYAALNDRVHLPTAQVQYLGWLPRPRLWEAFADHDLLVVPSTILEAFGLVAIEAQARGLPVAYQPVPGLREVLAGSALPLDFADPTALAAALDWLRTDATALTELRTAGLRNAARYPLSQTVRRLTDLNDQIT